MRHLRSKSSIEYSKRLSSRAIELRTSIRAARAAFIVDAVPLWCDAWLAGCFLVSSEAVVTYL